MNIFHCTGRLKFYLPKRVTSLELELIPKQKVKMPKYRRKRNFIENYDPLNPLVDSTPNRTLKVIILDCFVEITTHSLYYIFSYYGSVLRIVTFNKVGYRSALVEYDSVEGKIK